MTKKFSYFRKGFTGRQSIFIVFCLKKVPTISHKRTLEARFHIPSFVIGITQPLNLKIPSAIPARILDKKLPFFIRYMHQIH